MSELNVKLVQVAVAVKDDKQLVYAVGDDGCVYKWRHAVKDVKYGKPEVMAGWMKMPHEVWPLQFGQQLGEDWQQ